MLNINVSGSAWTTGPRSAGGEFTDYLTPLEAKFAAEVYKGASGMSRAEANEVLKEIIPKYEDKLKSPPKGKPFPECYNLKELKPNKKWMKIYSEVKDEAKELGIL